VLDPNLVFLVVDNLFGGDGRFHTRVEGRDFTPTEQRIIQGLLKVTFDEYVPKPGHRCRSSNSSTSARK
jgi:flagellar motor switch protein FliM